MRRAAKADRNQPEIVNALESAGATVQHLHTVGGGCPDIAVGYRGQNFLVEIKDGKAPPSARGLTDAQLLFHSIWRGQVAIAESIDDAFRIVGIKTGESPIAVEAAE